MPITIGVCPEVRCDSRDECDSLQAAEITIPNMRSKGKLKERTVQLPVSKAVELTPEPPRYKQELVSVGGEQFLSVTVKVPKLVSDILSLRKSSLHSLPKTIVNTEQNHTINVCSRRRVQTNNIRLPTVVRIRYRVRLSTKGYTCR